MNDSGWISVCNWEREYQHADTTRSGGPLPWVKNYTRLMADDDYLSLTPGAVAILHRLWLVYASSRCRLRADTRSLSSRLSLRVTSSQLDSLVHAGFIRVVASKEQAEGAQNASSRTRELRGEVEREVEREVRSESLAKGYSASSASPEFDNNEQHKLEPQPEPQQLPASLERDNGMGTLNESVDELRARLTALGEDVPA